MIKFIKGDLLKLAKDGEFDIIIHGCNINHIMGAGIAKQIREQFPSAYLADKETIKGDKNKIGTYSSSLHKSNKKIMNEYSKLEPHYFLILNAYTQNTLGYGNDVFEYDGFEKILKEVSKFSIYYKKIGLPLIGCGLAGGDKEHILKIIEDTIGHMDVTIVEWSK